QKEQKPLTDHIVETEAMLTQIQTIIVFST
ncbi:unnamed protein product, partial [Onchocerca ochengi]